MVALLARQNVVDVVGDADRNVHSEEVRNVAALFGMNFWNDEGFWTHSFHTAVADRDGRLVGNLEGNQFSAKQLGDVVESALNKREADGRNRQPHTAGSQ